MSREETFFLLAFGMPMSLGGIASSERPERKVNLFEVAEKARKKSIEVRKAKEAEEAEAAAKLKEIEEEVVQKQKSMKKSNKNSDEGPRRKSLRPPLIQPQQYSLESEGYHSGREDDISDNRNDSNSLSVDETKITRSSPNVGSKTRKSEIILGTKGEPEVIIQVKNDPIWGPTYIRRPKKSNSPRNGPPAEEVIQESTTTKVTSLDRRPSPRIGSKSPRISEVIEESNMTANMDRKPSPRIGSKSPMQSGSGYEIIEEAIPDLTMTSSTHHRPSSRIRSRSPMRLGSEDNEAIPDLATSSTRGTPERSCFEIIDTGGIPDLTSSSPTREPSPRVGFALDMIVETIPNLRTSSPVPRGPSPYLRTSSPAPRGPSPNLRTSSPAPRGPSPRVGFAEIVEAIPDVRTKSPLPREPSPHPTLSRKGSASGWPSYARPTSPHVRSKSKSIEIVETIPGDGRVWPDPGAYAARGPSPMLQPHSQQPRQSLSEMIEARPKPAPLGSDARKFSREESFFLLAFGMPMAVEPSCTMDHGK